MKLKNVLLVVRDLERSKKFYKTLFGLEPIRDLGENVILMEGLVLQERESWEDALGKRQFCRTMERNFILRSGIWIPFWSG